MIERIGGVVLAGGLSRRMGGGDKALLRLAGHPLARHIAERLAPQVDALIVNANGDPERFAGLGLPVVPDETADFAGPLAGVLAALNRFARAHPEIEGVVSVAGDAPFVPRDLVARLADALAAHGDARVAVAASRGRRHHVTGLWRMAAAAEIAAALARGERRAETMIDRLGVVVVPFADLDIGGAAVDPFFNINTPDELAHAARLLARLPSSSAFPSTSPSLGQPATAMMPPLRASTGRSAGAAPFVVGVAGWKNSGKTTLVERLVAELVGRGFRVATVKHSHHHDLSAEARGTDSARHRRAGASAVALLSPARWAILRGDGPAVVWHEEPEPPLAAVIAQLGPADIVIVEGLKGAPIPKIEVRGAGQGEGPPLAGRDPLVFAVADDSGAAGAGVATFSRDDVAGIADTLLASGGRERQAPT
jgi:molybdenum cofactor guanylyltransferase/molybdopterin-guanine dinucleotide biosynthesis protein MobB